MFDLMRRLTEHHSARWSVSDALPTDFTPEERDATLERVPFFASLRPADRRALCSAGVTRTYPAGAVLVHEGQQPGVGLYVILRGRVRLTQRSEYDGIRPLGVIGPGEMFGEMALLDDQPRSATATAIEPTLALIIPIVDFRATLYRNAEATVVLLKQLSRRVRQAERALRG